MDPAAPVAQFTVPLGGQKIEMHPMDFAAGGLPLLRVRIRLRIHRHRADAEAPAGADDPAGNLATVRNQDFVEHSLGIFRRGLTRINADRIR